MVGETNRLPFDLAEGEGELTGGFHTEYGSMRFAMFFLGEYINMFTVAALATTMFLGGPAAPPGIAAINDGMFNQGWWGLLWFTAKLWLFMFFFVWLRGSLPRVRYDQFMRFGWKFLIPATLGLGGAHLGVPGGRNGWFDSLGHLGLRQPILPRGDPGPDRAHRRGRPRSGPGCGTSVPRPRKPPPTRPSPTRSTRTRVDIPCHPCPASAWLSPRSPPRP
jgi:hypothetical protein